MLNKKAIAIFCLSLVMSFSARAEDMGAIGQVYPILEMDFLDYIQAKLNFMQQSGELQQIQDKFKARVIRHSDRPIPVSGVSKALQNKTWLIDPSITVPYDLRDGQGRVFAQQGSKVNPLALISIHHPMVFINGDDLSQIQWLQRTLNGKLKRIKLVLTSGSISELSKRLHQPVYFDQGGKLIANFHIQHVPAVVEQEGLKLKISEIKV